MVIKKSQARFCPPPLLAPYSTLCGLYQQLSQTPLEETVRLAFADALREAADEGGPGASDLGDLSSLLQLESQRPEKLPPRRFDRADLRSKGGPNYYQFTASDEDSLEVGQRVDVIPDFRMRNPPLPLYFGRVVSVCAGGWPGELQVTVCRDDKSGVDLASLWREYAAKQKELLSVAMKLLQVAPFTCVRQPPGAGFSYPWVPQKVTADVSVLSSSRPLSPESPLIEVLFSAKVVLRIRQGLFSDLELSPAHLFLFSSYFGTLPISRVWFNPRPRILHRWSLDQESVTFFAHFGDQVLEYTQPQDLCRKDIEGASFSGLFSKLRQLFPQVGEWKVGV